MRSILDEPSAQDPLGGWVLRKLLRFFLTGLRSRGEVSRFFPRGLPGFRVMGWIGMCGGQMTRLVHNATQMVIRSLIGVPGLKQLPGGGGAMQCG